MKAELLSIGDELLIGQTVNTNASWLGMELSLIGISVHKCTVISDSEEAILNAIDEGFKNSDLIIVTGGLGPTKDDITKHTLCRYFNTTLEINPKILARVENFFKSRGREMLEVNIQQAALPKNCHVLDNVSGTASGMWFEQNGSILISLPGVPYEMKGIMRTEVFPKLMDQFKVSKIFHKTILLQGIGESFLAERVKDWEDRIKEEGLGLAYLPSTGMLKLRITSVNGVQDEVKIDVFFKELQEELPQYVYGFSDTSLSEVVGDLLKRKKLQVGTVESCTGGALAQAIVSVSGASDYYKGSLLTYSNELKMKLADVTEASLNEFGAVSEQVVLQMAKNGREKLGVDVCIATSGVAGPGGGSEQKPVGTVFIGVAFKDTEIAYRFQFGDNRERNIEMSVLTALNLLRCNLLEISMKK
jgi:nicotinamide-nucleotide amidase